MQGVHWHPIRHLLRIWALVLFAVWMAACQSTKPVATGAVKRFVSLSPAVTETLFALGAGSQVVGISDYCHFPPPVEQLPRVGSGFTPRYEAIVGLAATQVFVEAVNYDTVRDLAKVMDVRPLKWLTLEDVIVATRTLGQLTGAPSAAKTLVAQYQGLLEATPAKGAPRVLLVLAHSPGQLQEAWFIRKNSIHGRVLEAAGAINAASDAIVGAPRLSLEQVIELDPDGIIILRSAERPEPQLTADWTKLTALRAVKSSHVRQIAAPEVMIPGPRIVELVKRLVPIVAEWSHAT